MNFWQNTFPAEPIPFSVVLENAAKNGGAGAAATSKPAHGVLRTTAAHIRSGWRWLQRARAAKTATLRLRVTETVSLGEKRFLSIVEVGDTQFLIGTSASHVQLLAHLAPSTSEAAQSGVVPADLSEEVEQAMDGIGLAEDAADGEEEPDEETEQAPSAIAVARPGVKTAVKTVERRTAPKPKGEKDGAGQKKPAPIRVARKPAKAATVRARVPVAAKRHSARTTNKPAAPAKKAAGKSATATAKSGKAAKAAPKPPAKKAAGKPAAKHVQETV